MGLINRIPKDIIVVAPIKDPEMFWKRYRKVKRFMMREKFLEVADK
ncbi:MAG: hypothetical protein QW039_00005 [Fervidicoccaceae archaeon]